MLPFSAKRPVPFRGFLVKPADPYERAAFRRAVGKKGARYPSDREMSVTLKEDIRATAPEDQQEGLIAIVEGAEALIAAGETLVPEVLANLAEIEATVRSMAGRFAALEAERVYYLDVAPIVAAEMFLIGREDGDPLPRKNGMLTDGALDGIGRDTLEKIGYEAMRLMNLSETDRKNSDSDSPSSASPTASVKTMETAGTSSATNTKKTPSRT